MKLSSHLVSRAIAGHSLVALALSALLYIVCLTGTLSVFQDEMIWWEQPSVPDTRHLTPAQIEQAAQAFLAGEALPPEHLFVRLPDESYPGTVISTSTSDVFVASDGTLGAERQAPWTEFLLDLHYHLNLPGVVGLTLVGVLGVVLMSLMVTGLLGHPKLVKDAFRLRWQGSARVKQLDLHNRLGVWSAPFILCIALTGAAIGLASVTASGIASLKYAGDTEAVFASIFGEEAAPDHAPAPLASIAGPIRYMAEHYSDMRPNYVILHEPQTRGQHSQILARHPQRLIFGEYYEFDADGQFQGAVGLLAGAGGQQVAASLYTLHFGSFAGLPVKWLYFLLGLGLCMIIHSGMKSYFLKRRQRGRIAPRLESLWMALVWGTPAVLAWMLAASCFGWLQLAWAPFLFWGSQALLLAAATLWHRQRIDRALQGLLGSGLLVALFWQVWMYQGALLNTAVLTVSVLLAMAVAGVLVVWRRTASSRLADPISEAHLSRGA